MNFDTAFKYLLGNEGGYVNDPQDPGGETKFGISKRAYPEVNIAALTVEAAKAIYKRDYWDKALADHYDGMIGFHLFDTAVNSGVDTAIKLLQRAVEVKPDGAIGPASLAAINARPVAEVVARFNAERMDYLSRLPTWDRYGRGWVRRIANNLRIGD